MNFSDIMQHKIAISLAIILIVCTMSAFAFVTYQPTEDTHNLPQRTITTPILPSPLQTMPVTSTPTSSEHADFCFVHEVLPDYFMPNATVVHLTSDDLKKFPAYEQSIAGENNFSKTWINGHRTVGNFLDYQHQFSDFRNLSCKNSQDLKCDPWKTSQEFEYAGRYYEVGCLPDFGGARPPPLPLPAS